MAEVLLEGNTLMNRTVASLRRRFLPTGQNLPGDEEHVQAEDLADGFVAVAVLDEADGVEGPVGPGQRLLAGKPLPQRAFGPERLVARAPRAATGNLAVLGSGVGG